MPSCLTNAAIELASLAPAATLADAPPINNFQSFMNFLSANGLWVLIAVIVVVAIVAGTIKETVKARAKEQSRREIAAYIAEGSMTPEQGERLMRSGRHASDA